MSFFESLLEEAFRDRDPGSFPFSLGVEVTNHCNLRCPMCPREISDRAVGKMPFELFARIVDETVSHEHGVFLPQGFGESFIHPRFREMVRYAREKRLSRPFMLISNGTLLDEKNGRALINSQIDFLVLSVDGVDPEIYEAIRPGARLENVVANVEAFLRLRKELGSQLPRVVLRMIKMEGTLDQEEAFRAFWEPRLDPGDEIVTSAYQTWGGAVEDRGGSDPDEEDAPEKRGPCRMIYKTLQVYHDGRCTPCCYDHECVMDVGNVQEASIREIWNGERLREVRRLHEEGRIDEISICRGCKEYIP